MATQTFDPELARQAPEADAPRVVVIGAGFGGLAAVKALGGQGVRVTVVDRLNYHLFQPLLYQVALASLSATDIAVPIRSIVAEHRNVEVLLGEVLGFDLVSREVRLTDGTSLGYDYLVVAAGSGTNYYGNDQWAPFAPGLKDLDDALEIRRRVLTTLERAERATDSAERRRLLTFAIVGGGPTGVELAGAIADLSRDILRRDFRHLDPTDVRVVVLEATPRILSQFVPELSDKAHRQLEELRVEVRTGVTLARIDAQGVWLAPPARPTGDEASPVAPGELVPAATVLWGAGVKPSPLARALGVPLDRGGKVIVGPDCSVPGHPELFVIGDLASYTPPGEPRPLPGLSPVAVQQGRHAAASVLRRIRGVATDRFVYFDKGFMATIGKARAVAQLHRLRLSGFVAWLAWVFVHLWYLVGFRNRVSVFLNWFWSYVMTRHGARLITGPTPRSSADAPVGPRTARRS